MKVSEIGKSSFRYTSTVFFAGVTLQCLSGPGRSAALLSLIDLSQTASKLYDLHSGDMHSRGKGFRVTRFTKNPSNGHIDQHIPRARTH
ncbi:hypothetical protein ACVWYH_006484 [Bradyrhizobium sp. GM24.11]